MTDNIISLANIIEIRKGSSHKEENTSEALTSLKELLKEKLPDPAIKLDQDSELEMTNLYQKLSWTEQLRIRIGRICFYFLNILTLFSLSKTTFFKMAKPSRKRF